MVLVLLQAYCICASCRRDSSVWQAHTLTWGTVGTVMLRRLGRTSAWMEHAANRNRQLSMM